MLLNCRSKHKSLRNLNCRSNRSLKEKSLNVFRCSENVYMTLLFTWLIDTATIPVFCLFEKKNLGFTAILYSII